ncbi:1094_t:CDS:1, partial [Acaulospora morrowiae]
NVDTDNAEHQISSDNTEISETGGPGKISSEIIEEVPRNEESIESESLPETETKISISTEFHVSYLSKAE